MATRQQLKAFYEQACEEELLAFKPGNVSVYHDGHDMTVEDFRQSYRVSSNPITCPEFSLGEKIYYAVKATREAVGCNTNLGIVLLCAPLIQVAENLDAGQSLQTELTKLLANTTRQDAAWVFKAISLASPGGLGESESEDVSQQPTVTLTEAMEIASEKDRIAYQFATVYKDIFQFTIFVYNSTLAKFGERKWAAVSAYTALLSRYPDSHVERKYGMKYSSWLIEQMNDIHQALMTTENPELLLPVLHQADKELKQRGVNPGTSADMTVATVLVNLLEAVGQ